MPRFKRMEVGRIRRISLANAESRVDGEREVVTRGRGSAIPDRWLYSSSISSGLAAIASSYLWAARRGVSFARAGARGFPVAREAVRAARLAAVSAERRVRARR